ncbi:MAG TPA: F0F1 ATP synthase subunit epsilon [Steroidobacteraceae bacterium]|jgi:F-type H+-transporting ATPase subunit epsilon|nr:F0F1 ATP synthase subunit epsilon [Steroidobacteraceae bacterium]
MDSTIQVDIVSAEGEIFAGPARVVFLPAVEGEIGVHPRHAPLLTMLKPGEVRVQTPDGEEHSFYVGGGALEIQPNKVTVLADTAARARDLDEAAALAARQRAQEALTGRLDKISYAEAQAELARAAAQLKLIQKLRRVKG